MIFKRIAVIVAAFAALLLMGAPATAGPITEADITYDTACGAPGIGWRYAGKYRDYLSASATGVAGERVNAAGFWTNCAMPQPDKDCQTNETPLSFWTTHVSRFDGKTYRGPTCTPNGDVLAGMNGDTRVLTADRTYTNGKKTNVMNAGFVVYQCQAKPDGTFGWVVIDKGCR